MGQPTLPAPRWRTGAELIRRREEKKRARARNREHIKGTALSDITTEQELAMRRKARKCPLCGIKMTNVPGLPASKELDHIVPVCIGGTHTLGNVRIICRLCNQRRPKGGSDYSGPVTLWAQGPSPVKRARKKHVRNVALCGKGLHPWTAENIGTGSTGKKYCKACRSILEHTRNPPRPCAKCGTPTALPGSQHMCPACIESSARKAAELHAEGGLSWNEIAPLVGYNSGTGAWYAAKRIGYVPAPKAAEVKVERPCLECGKTRPKYAQWCDDCTTAKAWRAVEMRRDGRTLADIAGQVGLKSKTGVTNLMKTVVTVEPKMGRPRKDESLLSVT